MAKENTVKKASKQTKRPVKQTINFALMGVEKINWFIAVPAIIVIIILAALFGKVSVVDRYAKLNSLKAEEKRLERQRDSLMESINEYDDVDGEYSRYTYESFNEQELSFVDRNHVFKIIEEEVLQNADISSWSLSQNILVMNVTNVNLADLSKISKNLEALAEVSFCMVSNATTIGTVDNSDEADEENLIVSAVMTAYLVQDYSSMYEDEGDME